MSRSEPWFAAPETASVEELLIAVASPDAAEDSPERKIAWNEIKRRDRVLRREMWLNHGCPFAALYGDDGEMACNACGADFKRQPFGELESVVFVARARRAENSHPGSEA